MARRPRTVNGRNGFVVTSETLPHQKGAIQDVLARYFDGLYEADSAKLATVFHPDARYVCATDSPLVQLSMGQYFNIVDTRVSPSVTGDERQDEVVSIEMAGPSTAAARVHCVLGPKYFTDLLTLIHVEGRWQIISKVFHYDQKETP